MGNTQDAKQLLKEREKKILSDLKTLCPNSSKYYDRDIDGFVIPVDIYNSSDTLINEMFALVHHTGNYGMGVETWVMYAREVDGVDTLFVVTADLMD